MENYNNHDTEISDIEIETILEQMFGDEAPKEAPNIERSINNSVKQTRIKKDKSNSRIIKVGKNILILAITAIIAISTINVGKIAITHYKTEQIKEVCVTEFYDNLKKQGLETEKLTPEGIIYNSNPEYLKDNLFEFYLIINKTYEYKERKIVLDLLVKKAGLAETFKDFLITNGYHKREYYSSNGTEYYLSADEAAWANTMEAIKLSEVEAQKNKGAR